jgi:hypothetical protein
MLNKYLTLFKLSVSDINIIKPDTIKLYNQLLPIEAKDYVRNTRIKGNLLGYNQSIINQTNQLVQSNFLYLLSGGIFKVVLLPVSPIKHNDLILNVNLDSDLSNTKLVFDKLVVEVV